MVISDEAKQEEKGVATAYLDSKLFAVDRERLRRGVVHDGLKHNPQGRNEPLSELRAKQWAVRASHMRYRVSGRVDAKGDIASSPDAHDARSCWSAFCTA